MSKINAHLLIFAGDDRSVLIARALNHRQWFDTPHVTLALADRGLLEHPAAPGPLVAVDLQERGVDCRLVVPQSTTAGAWFRSRQISWQSIALSNSSGRLERVWLPDAIAQATALFAVNALPPRPAGREPIAIGIWAKFAHPRQRTGAWLSDARDGLIAEIASAVHPALILLFTEWKGFPLLIASDDQVVAELAGLAIQQLREDPFQERAGPWEHPLVQHATELNLGVSHPGEIGPEVVWAGPEHGPAAAAFGEFAAQWLARIGVKWAKETGPAAYT